MYLIDTNVLSELRKKRANQGVVDFFYNATSNKERLYISVVTVGEILTGIEKLKLKNDKQQAEIIEAWFTKIMLNFQKKTLDFNKECAEQWSLLMANNPHNLLDKQIGATALVYDLTLVTRNEKDFINTDVKLLNPFI